MQTAEQKRAWWNANPDKRILYNANRRAKYQTFGLSMEVKTKQKIVNARWFASLPPEKRSARVARTCEWTRNLSPEKKAERSRKQCERQRRHFEADSFYWNKKWASASEEQRAHKKENNRRRVAGIGMACPDWLTNDDLREMRIVYLAAERLCVETRVPHEVDHIVPLAGCNVCGLHVPWNLQVLPRTMNRSKHNRIIDSQEALLNARQTDERRVPRLLGRGAARPDEARRYPR